MRQLVKIAAWTGLAALVSSGLAAFAGDCEDGVRLYNQRQYAAAAACFERCLAVPVMDPNFVYYAAMNAQRLQQYDKARTWYKSLVQHFPSSEAGRNAAIALRQMGSSAGNTYPGESASLPRETWVPFMRAGSHLIMDVEINRKPEQMVFDTGADFTLLSGKIISDLGMGVPNRPPDGYSGGVGNRQKAAMWLVPVDIKVGSIERRNFRVGLSEAPQSVALLGRDFLKGLQYTINDADKTVTFKRADTADSTKIAKTGSGPVGPDGSVTVTGNGTYVYNVPFTTNRAGQIIIEGKINGQPTKMIFDTGASVCFFTPDQAASSGINVPADAQVVPIYGVSGNTTARVCPIRDVKVGPLDEKDVTCAIGKSAAPMPLLGQSFFKAYKYTIDSTNKVIVFTKQN